MQAEGASLPSLLSQHAPEDLLISVTLLTLPPAHFTPMCVESPGTSGVKSADLASTFLGDILLFEDQFCPKGLRRHTSAFVPAAAAVSEG